MSFITKLATMSVVAVSLAVARKRETFSRVLRKLTRSEAVPVVAAQPNEQARRTARVAKSIAKDKVRIARRKLSRASRATAPTG